MEKFDWLENPVPTPDSFEEGNMANILPNIELNISTNPEVVEGITLGEYFSPKEVASYKEHFQEFYDIFAWSYIEMPRLDQSIIEHHIDTWPDVVPIH